MTLTELICCIAILSILAMIIIPMILGYIDEAKIATDRANTKIIENTIVRACTSGKDISNKNIVNDILIKELGGIPKIQSQGNFQYNWKTARVSITLNNIPDIDCYLLVETSTLPPSPTPTSINNNGNNGNHNGQNNGNNGNHNGQNKKKGK